MIVITNVDGYDFMGWRAGRQDFIECISGAVF